MRLLDLCCGAGGASVGYHRVGFEVVGVDIVDQPNYPFEFYRDDALEFDLDGFDVIHVSPPCQGYSLASYFHNSHKNHPKLINVFRERLKEKVYVIENVTLAKKDLINPIVLCGEMFGLRVYRHRLFESNIPIKQPKHIKHKHKAAKPGAIPKAGEYWSVGGHFGQKDEAQKAMGIDWMKRVKEIANAIPPAYTEHIGLQIARYINESKS